MYKILLSPNGKILKDSSGKILIWYKGAVAFIEGNTLVFETGVEIGNNVLFIDGVTIENNTLIIGGK